MFKLFSALLLAIGIVFAMPSAAQQQEPQEIFGTLRDTTSADPWQVRYLGGQSICDAQGRNCDPNADFDWANQRTYTNGILNAEGYNQAYRISDSRAGQVFWNTNIPWVSSGSDAFGLNGYYSYVVTIDDDFSGLGLGAGQTATFNGLWISYASDDHLHAIIVNGVQYDGFTPQAEDYSGWVQDYVSILLSDIAWNIDGSNTIEFIVHNNNSGVTMPGTFENEYNATGLSATIQAAYYATSVPEPSVLLMWSLGSMVLAGVSRSRTRRMKKSTHP